MTGGTTAQITAVGAIDNSQRSIDIILRSLSSHAGSSVLFQGAL